MSIKVLKAKVLEAISKGADVNDPSRNGHRPLHLALRRNYPEIAQILIEHGADVRIVDKGGLDPLHLAINHGNYKIANQLIKKGIPLPIIPDLKFNQANFYEFYHFHSH